jgi:antitoxin component YwqK of YwqJK toxin-antitoxin module
MKKLGFVFGAVLCLNILSAQTLNDKGLYIENENDIGLFSGKLFNGIVSKTQNGIKSEFTVKEGVLSGPANCYYASGQLMESGAFKEGKKDQKWIRYNLDGNISAVAFYEMGKKTGIWVVYDDKQQKRFEMTYDKGEKTGVWISWDENGAVASTKNYAQFD